MASTNEFGPDSGGRVKGVTIVKPIVYGNIARYFGKKREEDGHTHQWTVYVKPYHNEDMSTYVKKVHFKLHESYNNPNRIVTKPPYELTETGWGEFEIVIKIYFHDPNERPVTIYHILKLFQSTPEIQLGKKSLVSEFYEEIVFQDPTALMQHLLNTTRPITVGTWRHNTDFNNGERAVWTFTLRDSEEDFINVTVWGTVEFVKKLVATFRIGTIVEVINAKIIARQAEDRDEMFVPLVSIPYKLIVNEGIALIQKHDAPTQHIYEKLLTIPTRSVKSLQTLKFLLHQIENLCDQYVDILVVITFVSGERNIVTRDGRKLKCRNFEATDGSSDSSIVFILWENEWVERAASWQPKYTVLFLADARIIFDKFKKKMVISIVRRTLIIENPNIPETELVRKAVDHYCRDVLSTDSFAVPNPDTIVTVMTIEEISERLNQGTIVKDGRLQFATILKAIVTDMNVDDTNPGLISTRCALCKKPVVENRDSCMNLDCPCGNGTRAPFNATTINVKVNLKDDSGYLIGCRLSGEGAECAFSCTAAEFQAMTVTQRADLKWKYILEKCDIRLHVLGPTSLFPRALYNILSIRPITEENMEQNQPDETHNI